jgi:mRNA-degrading endonuclease RelE of RelBE toxin-antitoxin system
MIQMFNVIVKKKVQKNVEKMPPDIKKLVVLLIDDLKEKGSILKNWDNFSKIGDDKYHCHLSYKWVACWKHEKNTIIIEVYYAGSRENAPY